MVHWFTAVTTMCIKRDVAILHGTPAPLLLERLIATAIADDAPIITAYEHFLQCPADVLY